MAGNGGMNEISISGSIGSVSRDIVGCDEVTAAVCPLGHHSVRLIEQIEFTELVDAWRREFGLIASNLIKAQDSYRQLDFCECDTCGLSFFYPLVSGDGLFYQSLAQSQWWGRVDFESTKPEWEVALRYISPGDAVLDVGCGNSSFADRLPKGCTYVGIDLNSDLIERARRAGKDVRLETIQDHAKDHQCGYDAVCLFQVIEHVDDLQSFISASAACVKPGGILIVGCPNSQAFLGMQCDNLMNMPPHHLTWWSKRPLEYLGHRLDMRIEVVEESELEKEYVRSFVRELWMTRLFGSAKRRRFVLSGMRYRLSGFSAKIMSRLTNSWISGFEPCIKGHTITAVYRKACVK